MGTQAIAAYGMTIQWNGELLAEVSNISGPGISFDTVPASHYTSPQHFKEFIAGFGDGGEVNLECSFIPGDTAGQVAFITDAFAKTVREVIITYPAAAGTIWTFDGLVTHLAFTQPMDNKLGFTATIKVSGVPELGITESTGATVMVGIEETGTAALDFVPDFDVALFTYGILVDTASTWIKLTVTAAGVITVSVDGGSETTLTTEVQSGEIAIGAADSISKVLVKVKEATKAAKSYTLYVARP